MGMGVENPLDRQPGALDVIEDAVGIDRRRRPGLLVEIENGVDNGASIRGGIGDDILHRKGTLVEEGLHVGAVAHHGTRLNGMGTIGTALSAVGVEPFDRAGQVDAQTLSERHDVVLRHPAVQHFADCVQRR